MDESRQKFLKIYANIPLGLRNDIVAVLDKEGPLTWNAAYIEIEDGTDIGKAILAKLEQMEII